MKYVFTVLGLVLLSLNFASAQTAAGDCNSVWVTSNPGYQNNLYGAAVGFKYTNDDCIRIITSGSNWKPRYQLQKRNANGTYTAVGGMQYDHPTFTGLSPGTYRICIENPRKDLSPPCTSGISCYDIMGNFLGYWGYWPSSRGILFIYGYTNDVAVGSTVPADNSFTFVNATGADKTFDYGQIVQINTSATQNYDLWWIAIFENGGDNRYAASGWQTGTMPSIYNLTSLFQSANPSGQFEPLLYYTVQYVTKNSNCTYSSDWNVSNEDFFICPSGSGCRLANDMLENKNVKINANNGILTIFNLDFNNDRKYAIDIYSMDGRKLKTMVTSGQTKIDISDLSSGMYMVNISEGGRPVSVLKFVK